MQNCLAKGLVERIGISNGELTHKTDDNKKYTVTTDIPDHTKGIDLILGSIIIIRTWCIKKC